MIVGVDFSVHAVDVVTLSEDDDTATWERCVIAAPDSFLAARNVRDALPGRSEWRDTGVIAIGIERPFSRGPGAGMTLMRLQGAIIACLPPELLVHEFPPASWKKATVGYGNATKEEVAQWALVRIAQTEVGFVGWPQDALDAYCIAYALRALVERGEQAA